MSIENDVRLIGNLGKDPELRYSQQGTAIANVALATSRTWTGKDGQKHEETEWHKLVAFGRQAEIIGEYLSKGSQMTIRGRLQTRSWDDNEGNKRWTTEIVVEEMKMHGDRKQQSHQKPQTAAEQGLPEENLPF